MPRRLKLVVATVVPSAAGALAWWICATSGFGLDVTGIVVGLVVLLPGTPLAIWAGQPQSRAPKSALEVPLLIGDLPREPKAFQPRPELRARLEAALRDEQPAVCALAGGRGVGKTQLAAVHARSCLDRRIPVAWLHAETTGQLHGSLDLMAAELGLRSDTDDADAVIRKIRAWLGKRREPYLVVFDNAVDPDPLAAVLPAYGPARVLITTNDHSFERVAALIPVERFTAREAAAYLRARLGHDDPDAERLADELDRLPLALSIAAAALIGPPRLSAATYLVRLHATPIDVLLERPRGEPYSRGVAQAIMLSIDQVGAAARRLLGELSLLSASGAGLGLFETDQETDRVTNQALTELATGSLVTFSRDDATVYVHRLVRRAVRDQADRDGTLVALIESAAGRLCTIIEAIADKDTWREFPTIMAVADHAAALWQAVDQLPLPQTTAAGLVLRARHAVARHLLYLNDDLRAGPVAEALVAGYVKVMGPEHPDTLSASNTLARTYGTTDADKSLRLHERILAERVRVLGADHPDTLWSRGAVASGHGRVGRADLALPLLESVIADQERLLPAGHPDLMQTRFSQASLTLHAGDPERAVALYTRLAADQERLYGADDPDLLVIRGRVAWASVAAGHPDAAIALYEQVIADQERVIGADHPDTVVTWQGLAAAYAAAGRRADARTAYARAIQGFTATLGPEHSLTKSAQADLARSQREGRD